MAVAVQPPLTLRDLQEALNVSRDTALRYCQQGLVTAFRTPGGEWRISREELARITQPTSGYSGPPR